jgi:hypothetical protein
MGEIKKGILVITALFMTVGLRLHVSGKQLSSDLSEKRITIQMTNKPLYDVFVKLMYDYDVPIGFEESTLDSEHDDYYFQTIMPRQDGKAAFDPEPGSLSRSLDIKGHLISVNVKDAPLKDVLDQIVSQMRFYRWTINDDVVNIFPIKGRDQIFEKLLNLKIREFKFAKDKELGMIQPTFAFGMPELKRFLVENNAVTESDRYVPKYADSPIPVELYFTDLTFKELLNRITRSKRGGWILRRDKRHRPENSGKQVIEILI